MTVTYHSGRRLQGLDADRTATALPSGSVGGWVELGRTTLGSAGDTIDVTSLADKRYLMVLGCGIGSGNVALISRFNSDTGNNYNNRYCSNGGADATSGANDRLFTNGSGSSPQEFSVFYVANKSDKEKLLVGHNVNNATAGAGTAPQRREYANKWANTSSVISSLNVFNSDTGDFASGSEVVVLGYDPADTHTTNFWQELLSETVGSDVSTHTFSSFAAKKYLWIQLYYKFSGVSLPEWARPIFQFNGDTGNNYSERGQVNGGSETTNTSSAQLIAANWDNSNTFTNVFIINNASNEKLGIQHWVNEESTGAGTAPHRREIAFKWANTSSQITSITLKDAGGYASIDADTTIKVWGAD